jgi:hypothetical protein
LGFSRTTNLSFKSAKDLINALAFADEILLPRETVWFKWAHLTAILDQSDGFNAADPRAYMALQGRILAAVCRFLRCRGLPTCHLWVREIRPRYGDEHTHVLLPLPPEHRDALTDLIYRVGRLHDTANNRAVVITTNGPRGIDTPASRAGTLRDLLKTMSPRARLLNGERVMPALGINNRAPCTILGKRSGTSQSLSRATRKRAGWRELETLHELRSVLPTGEEAKRERDRHLRERGTLDAFDLDELADMRADMSCEED